MLRGPCMPASLGEGLDPPGGRGDRRGLPRGCRWPFFKCIFGCSGLFRACLDAAGIGLFIFTVLCFMPLQGDQCPLCAASWTQ